MSEPKYTALEPDCQKIHIIVDTESLGLKHNSVITEIAAHVFNHDEWFAARINPQGFDQEVFLVDPKTVEWHEQRHKGYFHEAVSFGQEPGEVADKFVAWVMDMEAKYYSHAVIWTRGIDFDIPLLTHYLSYFDLPNPWHYRNVRDLRTLGALLPEVEVIRGDHTALGDVQAAAKYMHKLAWAHPMISNMLGFYPTLES